MQTATINTCQIRTERCNGKALRPIFLRAPHRATLFELKPKVSCQGCRMVHWGGFRNCRPGEQQVLGFVK